jgi:pyridoxine 5-phosphate synthase
MMRLGVNIDHVATLRQLRDTPYPNLLLSADQAVRGGAHQITVHLREDRRHIQDADVVALKKHLSVPLNLEMCVAPAIVKIACDIRPTWACLVPEKRQERTTEGGLDLIKNAKAVGKAIEALKKKAIRVSLFIEPAEKQIKYAQKLGADAVELHTGAWALETQAAKPKAASVAKEFKRIEDAVAAGRDAKLAVHAGHGLDYENVRSIAVLPIEEVNIGHSIICRAIDLGLELAVRHMISAMRAP